MKPLSKTQKAIYDYVEQSVRQKGYPPSVREIGAVMGLQSPSTVHFHLKRLEAAGWIIRDAGKGRAITLLHSDESEKHQSKQTMDSIPVLGRVAAGKPILAEENIEDYLPFHTNGHPEEYFALHVRGDSMINAGILSGDLVVVHRQPSAENREIVVALLEDSATVKRLYLKDNHTWLLPENDAYPPIDGDDAQILGKVTALFRCY